MQYCFLKVFPLRSKWVTFDNCNFGKKLTEKSCVSHTPARFTTLNIFNKKTYKTITSEQGTIKVGAAR